MFFLSFPATFRFLDAVGRDEEPSGEKCPPPDFQSVCDVDFDKIFSWEDKLLPAMTRQTRKGLPTRLAKIHGLFNAVAARA